MTMSGGECPMIPENQGVFPSLPVCDDGAHYLKEFGKEK